jgi:S-DNA-T family DNA segregation ATPase FtsK/SpoIIIE
VDRGTAVCKGFTGERGEIVQVHKLDVEKANDDVTPIVRRSLAAIEGAGRSVPQALPAIEARDLLEDVAAVLANEDAPVPVADVAARLRKLAPAWAPYRSMRGVQLRKRLDDEYGLVLPSTGNRWPVNPDAVRAVLSDRRLDDEDLVEELS